MLTLDIRLCIRHQIMY